MSENGFSLKLGRFYKGDEILQHEEVLDLLNEIMDLKSELVDCKALIQMLADTTVSGTVDSIVYNRYSFNNEREYYAELNQYKEKIWRGLND